MSRRNVREPGSSGTAGGRLCARQLSGLRFPADGQHRVCAAPVIRPGGNNEYAPPLPVHAHRASGRVARRRQRGRGRALPGRYRTPIDRPPLTRTSHAQATGHMTRTSWPGLWSGLLPRFARLNPATLACTQASKPLVGIGSSARTESPRGFGWRMREAIRA